MMMMMEIQSKADAVKQLGRSVEQYASELSIYGENWIIMPHFPWKPQGMLRMLTNGRRTGE
jgi:hypothetical protein